MTFNVHKRCQCSKTDPHESELCTRLYVAGRQLMFAKAGGHPTLSDEEAMSLARRAVEVAVNDWQAVHDATDAWWDPPIACA